MILFDMNYHSDAYIGNYFGNLKDNKGKTNTMSINKIHLRIMDGSIPNKVRLETIIDNTCQQLH